MADEISVKERGRKMETTGIGIIDFDAVGDDGKGLLWPGIEFTIGGLLGKFGIGEKTAGGPIGRMLSARGERRRRQPADRPAFVKEM